jgi:glycosyltransferase involved in cell wall biosynthesis
MVVRPSEGGAFGHVATLSRELARRNHEVAICGPHGAWKDLGVEVIELDIVRPISPPADLVALRRLAGIVRAFAPDVVHAHGSKGGVMARLARLATPRVPVVLTPHGYAFAGYFSRRSERFAYRSVETALARLASRVLCVCEAEARLAASVGPKRRIRVVHNGIEPPREVRPDPDLAALSDRGPVIVAITGLRSGKGDETLVRAFGALARAGLPGTLVIVGDGPERAAVEAESDAAGIADRVILLGERLDVFPILAASDIFVSPSWAESFPYSVLEAMAFGLPIVATDVGGVPEAIEDGATGLLVSPRDAAALERALGKLITDHDTARTLGAAANERMLARFTLSRMVERTLSVYTEVGVES